MTRNKTLLAALPALAVLGLATPAHAATVAVQQATIVSDGYVNSLASTGGQVGRDNADVNDWRAFGLFNVQDLLTTEGLTFADLSTFTFDFAFTTNAGTTLAAGTYKVGYAGFYANATFAAEAGGFPGAADSDWGLVPYAAADDIDTGIADLAGAQTITESGFSLSSLTDDGDLSNDFVVFGIAYDEPQATGVNQDITNGSMTLTAVPEPGSLALLGLGGLLIARRRRG